MLIHWIWFATRTGMGDKMKSVLLSHFEDPEVLSSSEPQSCWCSSF